MSLDVHAERALALAGLIQASYLISAIARTGMVGEDSMAGTLESIFVTNPDQTLDVYQNGNGVRTGLRLIAEIIGDLQLGEHGDTVRYCMAILNLEKKLREKPELLRAIGAGVSSIQEHRVLREVSVTSEDVVEKLSGLYEQTTGTIEPRIRVVGQQKHLQNRTNTCRIRALLLAGVRSAVLWRQLGGSLIQLILGRGRLLRSAENAAAFIS
ncbi:MAG: high frequency lysogenization protein HflD [Gammaproteobacteria bacterium]|jgi:high frequency lysogenization protein|nr:high frequency lysogenization protein HflD [Gammaproteobacteria bacterium]